MKYKDYYGILGVPRDADTEAIKKAYRKLAREFHPDMSKEAGSEAKFKEVGEAYATLKDPQKRAAYDALGSHGAGEEFSPPPQWQQAHPGDFAGFGDMDLADLLDALGRGARHRPRGAHPMHGHDLETRVTIRLEEAHRGTSVHLNLAGEGESRVLEVRVPAGVRDGQRLRLKGRGGRGRNGGADGDIYLHIGIAPHPVFRVDGHDLAFDLVLAPWEAVLGADVEVPTLEEPVLLTVPPGTQAGRKLRLRGRGLANGHGGRGHLHAVVRIDVPATVTPRERELYEQLARESTFDARATAPQGA